MSERINTSADRASFRWQLLTTVSALALLASHTEQANPKPRMTTGPPDDMDRTWRPIEPVG